LPSRNRHLRKYSYSAHRSPVNLASFTAWNKFNQGRGVNFSAILNFRRLVAPDFRRLSFA